MGVNDQGYHDFDMNHDFVWQWVKKYQPIEVVSPKDAEGLQRLAKLDPSFVWIEVTYGQTRIWSALEATELAKDGSLEVSPEMSVEYLYVCTNPFEKDSTDAQNGILVGDWFECEGCEGNSDAECATCSGEGGEWYTVHDAEVKDEIIEYCKDEDVQLPDGFFKQ
jgi:hypothetical protein